jgi:hypothetical protein
VINYFSTLLVHDIKGWVEFIQDISTGLAESTIWFEGNGILFAELAILGFQLAILGKRTRIPTFHGTISIPAIFEIVAQMLFRSLLT